MVHKMKYPILKGTKDNLFINIEDYRYKSIVVPKGYRTNGSNIPRILWSWIPPFKPKYLPAVLVHDYLCDLEEYKKADKYFEEILYNIEKTLKTKAMVHAVKIYHRIRYGVK